jgi:chorismate mutase/prephenate dehydratase
LFYLDFEGNIADARVAKGLDELKGRTLFLKVLGSYPARALAEEAMISTTQEAGAVAEPQPQEEPAPVAAPAVAKSKHYKLVSRDHRAEDTLIRVGNLLIGGDGFVVMAGPCSVESEEQIAKTAKFVKEHGAHILRGGVFKPRTSPYSFQGLGLDGLNLLREAGHHYGLPVVTEVMTLEAVKPIAEKSDILQIGARNMQNFPLLREVGKVDKPVLLKRGLMATLEELLAAAEYILSQGNGQVILCERGIRTFETSTRNTLDLTAVPVLKELTHLPVIVDPSHGTGKSRYVTPMALAGRVVGAHGLMIEVHPDPAQALSDGDQSLSFPEFAELMRRLRRVKV